MSVKKVDRGKLTEWVGGLLGKTTVYGVKAKGDKFDYDKLSSADDLRLDFDVTLTPPKKYFLPECEELLTFAGVEYKSVISNDAFVVMGVHPYDMAAINQVDKLFSDTNKDAHYFARRQAATIVAVDVESVSENCFAGSVGFARVGAGYDVLLTKLDDGSYVVDAATEKGEQLVASLEGAQADAAALDARAKVQADNEAKLRKHELKPSAADLPKIMEGQMDNPVWAEKAEKCFSCGSCNLVCPTCYCFDVAEDVNWDMNSGTRTRTWDSCMLNKFALCAGDHNFRGKVADRYRHRYYRKGKWVPEKIGELACVGCGRCISACVAKIANPPEIFNTLAEAAQVQA